MCELCDEMKTTILAVLNISSRTMLNHIDVHETPLANTVHNADLRENNPNSDLKHLRACVIPTRANPVNGLNTSAHS